MLGGGGVLGAAEVGMLRALFERNIAPDLIVGSSVGALNGAFIAAEPSLAAVDRMVEVWTGLSERGVFGGSVFGQIGTLARHGTHLHSNDSLRQLIDDELGPLAFDELAVRFECVAASIERAAATWFSSGLVSPAVLASCAVPGLLPPVEIDGQHYFDGGLVRSVPIGRAAELGATRIFVLHVGRLEQPLKPPTRPWQVAVVAFEIARRHQFGEELAGLPHDGGGQCPAQWFHPAGPVDALPVTPRASVGGSTPPMRRPPPISTQNPLRSVPTMPSVLSLPVRRLLLPVYVVAFLISAAVFAVGSVIGALVAPLTPRRRILRLSAFALSYAFVELASLTAAGLLWLRHAFATRSRPEGPPQWIVANEALLAWALGKVLRAGHRCLGFEVNVVGSSDATPLSEEAPVLVLARHGGPGDSFALVHLLLTRYHRSVRIVLKDILQLDPLIDILLHRLDCCFLASPSGDGAELCAKVAAMAATLAPREALLLFPEGANFTPHRRRARHQPVTSRAQSGARPRRDIDDQRPAPASRRRPRLSRCPPRSARGRRRPRRTGQGGQCPPSVGRAADYDADDGPGMADGAYSTR